MSRNRQVRLGARPVGQPKPEDWQHVTEAVPEPADGRFLVRTEYISLDPAMRGWMNDVRSYIRPVRIGEVMRAAALGRVVASKHPDFAEGDHVTGTFGVQEYAVSDGRGVLRADPARAPLTAYLGVLGLTGLTAYFGLIDVGKPREGDTVVVSGAAGAVGSVVGQIAKHLGCRVVGIAGGAEKCRLLTEDLDFDAAIDYRGQDVRAGLREHAPDGVDVYFDNVGGEILDTVLARLTLGARVVVCGAISQYNATQRSPGPANYLSLLVNRASMTGMLVFDYEPRYAEGIAALADWLAAGVVTPRETVVDGTVDDFPEVLRKLFTGENVGKLVLRVSG
ncbi:MAG: zinc-binding dehydrogenase [Actinophytocola sp.]|uniref:NADP-dependent oxidoreductase n=1 Tax=Actinophytocola sp. TaxID=1872138 RepID=UPI001328D8EC|nr:NADP-dependent oxidoreductase [Actinophytocola sp.]MPZ80459.1 zinc-binding dehydrogenase [Actinophytocola sp.]